MQSINIKTSFGDSYSLTAEESGITIIAYLTGSITDGSGTEKNSEIKGANLSKLLTQYRISTPEQLLNLVYKFNKQDQESFIESVTKLEKILHIWSETDWSDEK